MSKIKVAFVLVGLALASSCIETARDVQAQQESRERYRKAYAKSGGFDPISPSLGQKMK
jgi:hypothetical protein